MPHKPQRGQIRGTARWQAPSLAGRSCGPKKSVDPHSARPEQRMGRICHRVVDGHIGNVGDLL